MTAQPSEDVRDRHDIYLWSQIAPQAHWAARWLRQRSVCFPLRHANSQNDRLQAAAMCSTKIMCCGKQQSRRRSNALPHRHYEIVWAAAPTKDSSNWIRGSLADGDVVRVFNGRWTGACRVRTLAPPLLAAR